MKLKVKKATEKVNEWIAAGNSLKKSLSQDDQVMAMLLNQLDEFNQELPFLLQLSSDALKVKLKKKRLNKYCYYLSNW